MRQLLQSVRGIDNYYFRIKLSRKTTPIFDHRLLLENTFEAIETLYT